MFRNLINIVLTPKNSLAEEEIVILGRGASLAKLANFRTNIKTVILVNAFWDTPFGDAYYADPLIHEFIKDKEIIIVSTPAEHTKYIKRFLRKYKIKSCFQNSCNKTVRVIKPKKYFKNFPDEVITPFVYMQQNFPKTGSLGTAVLLGKYKYHIKKFHIFGLDFYEHDYYLKCSHNYMEEVEESELIKDAWSKFMIYNSDCRFNVYTYASLQSEENIYVQP